MNEVVVLNGSALDDPLLLQSGELLAADAGASAYGYSTSPGADVLLGLVREASGSVALASSPSGVTACLVALDRPLESAGFNPPYFDSRDTGKTMYMPAGGFVSSCLDPATRWTELNTLAAALATDELVAIGVRAWWDSLAPPEPVESLDEMHLMALSVSDCTAAANEATTDVTAVVARDLPAQHEAALLSALHDGFGREALATSPCPQLPSAAEFEYYYRHPASVKSLMWRDRKPIGAALIVPVSAVDFLDVPDADNDYFIYDIAVLPTERGWMTRHLLRPALDLMMKDARIWFDYTQLLNPQLPLGVARTFGLRRDGVREVDWMRWGLVQL